MVDGLWREKRFSHEGRYYRVQDAVLEPKPVQQPRPVVYAGGESEAARTLIADLCDAYVMHGDSPEVIARRVEDMASRRATSGPAAAHLRRGGLHDRARLRTRGAPRARADHQREGGLGRVWQLPAVDCAHAARAAGVARGLLGIQPRPAVGPGRDAGARPGAGRSVRSHRRRPAAAAVQPAARRDGTVRGAGDSGRIAKPGRLVAQPASEPAFPSGLAEGIASW